VFEWVVLPKAMMFCHMTTIRYCIELTMVAVGRKMILFISPPSLRLVEG